MTSSLQKINKAFIFGTENTLRCLDARDDDKKVCLFVSCSINVKNTLPYCVMLQHKELCVGNGIEKKYNLNTCTEIQVPATKNEQQID